MNDRINKFMLASAKFMPKMHLKQPAMCNKSGFTNIEKGPFTKKQRKNTEI